MHLPLGIPNIPSTIASVPHNTTYLPVPQPPRQDQSCPAETSSKESEKKLCHYQHQLCIVHITWLMKNIPITQIKMISTILFENGIEKWNSELSVSKWLPLLIVTLNLIKRFVTKLNPDGDTFTEAN